MTPPRLSAVRLPIPWTVFGFPEPFHVTGATLLEGDVAWAWTGQTPGFGVPGCETSHGQPVEGWDLDHVVLLVPSIADAVSEMQSIGLEPRLRIEVKGRPTAFFRVGPILEVIESPVRNPALFGVALVTDEPLETVALRWRSEGLTIGDVRPAIQPGRRIFTVKDTSAGLAVMSRDRDIPGHELRSERFDRKRTAP